MSQKISVNRDKLNKIGNKAEATYKSTGDLKAGMLGVKAFSEATKTAVAQVRYKLLTGSPTKIEFLEE